MRYPDSGSDRRQSFDGIQAAPPAVAAAACKAETRQTLNPTRILLLEDNILCSAQLAQDLEIAGHHVLGPFNDIAAAQRALPQAEAAILDVHIGKATSFTLAHYMRAASLPFVFYTGISKVYLPDTLNDIPVVHKPAPVQALLSGLSAPVAPCTTAEMIGRLIPVLQARAREIHFDGRRADLLVEAALRAALLHAEEIPRQEICKWLLHFVDSHGPQCAPQLLI